MPLVQAKCTNCGANLEVDSSNDAAVCKYCNAAFIVEKAINNYNIANAHISAENLTVNIGGESPTVTSMMKRAHLALEDKNWGQADGYFDKILDIAPEHAPAYIGRLMSELKISKEGNLARLTADLSGYANFQKGLRFADEHYKAVILEYQKMAYANWRQHNEEERKQNAVDSKNEAYRKTKKRMVIFIISAVICVFSFIWLPIRSNDIGADISDLLEPHLDRTPFDMVSFREKLDICLKTGTSYWTVFGSDKDRATENLISEFWKNGIMYKYESLRNSLFWHKFWFNAFGYIFLVTAIISGIAFIYCIYEYKKYR